MYPRSLTGQTDADACSAPLALINAVLGSSALSGCTCGSPPQPNTVAKFDTSSLRRVLSPYAAAQLFASVGTDVSLSVDLVGGLPLSCSASTTRGDIDVLPVYYHHQADALYDPSRRPRECSGKDWGHGQVL